MSPQVSFATTTLPYPIFAVDFDPYNRGYLVVGGGGGEGRSGVPNQIVRQTAPTTLQPYYVLILPQSVLDISDRSAISTVANIELSREEDSVQSLSNLATKDGLITFAGINSSQAEQEAGRNQHFRAFDIKIPPRKRQKGQDGGELHEARSTLLGKRALFKPSSAATKEKYQRLSRLSQAQRREAGSRRIGAVASGLSKPSEIIIFDATTATPGPADVLARIEPPQDAEAQDLDIAVADWDVFSVAWCTDFDLYEQTMDYDFGGKKVQKTPQGPRRIHQMPFPDTFEDPKSRPRFRCLRFLDAQNVLALVNRANRKGAELRIFHLYPTGPAAMVLLKRLPSHIKQAVSMDVCALDRDSSESRQLVVAVAGQDISIETYTLDYRGGSVTFSPFRSFQSFRNVHQHQMTKICFSPFHSPSRTSDGEGKDVKDGRANEAPRQPGAQYIRLASVSYGNTVVVDTFPLTALSSKDKSSRYVLAHPREAATRRNIYIILVSFVMLIMAYLLQSYLRGSAGSGTGLAGLLPPGARHFLDRPANAAQDLGKQVESSAASIVESAVPSSVPGKQRLQDLLSSHADKTKAVVVRDDPAGTELSVNVHPDREEYLRRDTEAKRWDELHEEEQSLWKQKLIRAGHWVESEGESVLKSLLWSQYAGFVGQAAGEALREL